MLKQLKYYISLCRPLNAFITAVTIFAAYLIAAKSNANLIIALAAALIGALTAAGGNVINDIFDVEADKINRSDKPLPSGKIDIKNAYVLYLALNAAALILSVILTNTAIIILCVTIVLLYLYSYILKKIIAISNITVALMTGLAFIFGGAAVNNIYPVIIPAGFAFLINLIREIVKDNIDVPGDKKTGVITIPSGYGEKFTRNLIFLLIFVLILSVNIPFVFKIYGIEYTVIINLILNPLLAYSIKLLYDSYNIDTLKKVSSILKLDMLIGLIAIIAGQ